MKTLHNNFLQFVCPALLFLVLGVVSCKEDEDSMDQLRMFMPTGTITSASGDTQVILTWKEALLSGGPASYTVEVATDTLFQTPVVFTGVTDTTAITFTDQKLEAKTDYFARIKTNAKGNVPESNWLVSSRFRIRGEQIFLPLVTNEIRDKSVVLRWRAIPGLTRIVLLPAGGTPITVPLTEVEAAAGMLKVSNLTATTQYTAEIFAGNSSKGITNFTTIEPSEFDVILQPGDDLVAAVAAAENGQVIGLNPGIYMTGSSILIRGKFVAIRSTSGNPNDTKVHFTEVTLEGTGAGVLLTGIEFDGTNAAGLTVADYFINIASGNGITLTSITVENCRVHDMTSAFLRANRGSAGGDQKIDFINVNNSIVSRNGIANYQSFMLDKLELNRLDVTNSTFNEAGRGFISYATNFTPALRPVFFVNKVTLNNFGSGGRNDIIFDGNAVVVSFTMQNSIIANAPKPGQTVGTRAMRAGTGSEVVFRNNNFFKLEGGNPAAPLIFPDYVSLSGNTTIDLGWTAATTDFSLPAA